MAMDVSKGKSIKLSRAAQKLLDQALVATAEADSKATPQDRSHLAHILLEDAPLEDLRSVPAGVLGRWIVAADDVVDADEEEFVTVQPLGDEPFAAVIVRQVDRAFIVDTLLGELEAQGLTVSLVSHPVLPAGQGKQTSLFAAILETRDRFDATALNASLVSLVEQIALVTGDWTAMLQRLKAASAEFRTHGRLGIHNAEIEECVAFLEWLGDHNFTLMGLREYAYEGDRETGELKPVAGSALGILRDDDLPVMSRGQKPVILTPEIRKFLFDKDPLIVAKANLRARVHRRVHLDYIGIKQYTPEGDLAGELRVVGLFTSTAYNMSVMRIPRLRKKVETILRKKGLERTRHSGKALINVLETWPRDDLFQIDKSDLLKFCDKAIRLDERPRIRVLPRRDKFHRYVSVLVYVPRERYDTDLRKAMGAMLEDAYGGFLSMFSPSFMENGLTRIQFIIGKHEGEIPNVSAEALEAKVTALVRSWADDLEGEGAANVKAEQFSAAYQARFSAERAVVDAALMGELSDIGEIAIDFLFNKDKPNKAELRLFHKAHPVPLSKRVPMLENMGFSVVEEFTFELANAAGDIVYLHAMSLDMALGDGADASLFDGVLEDALHAFWAKRADDDAFNALVLAASLSWQQVTVFRAYGRYLRQIESRYPLDVMARTLTRHPKVTRWLIKLFDILFDPDRIDDLRDDKAKRVTGQIRSALARIESSEEDAVLRGFLGVIEATLRTNFYALENAGTDDASADVPMPVLSLKIDPGAVAGMPAPVPYREIFVSSPDVEGTHIRFGPVARGGLRWSDRAQDYRTEVLQLVKAQQVKNAVIVPVGSKGGFYPKNLPPRSAHEAWANQGREAYRTYISSLLSVTDNLLDGTVVPPANTVRRDGDDPYFVVAADKGTARFSDTANGISQARDFWLDDAFASGGSAGYDHKAMGITAKGGWEAVKRHFREMDRDIQTEPFTTVGVGDMSGDVFGNGMLLSKQTKLIAAFDHRDIFIDPDPDPATSFKERQRLFKADRSSWQDYKADLISKGGGVFSRSDKTITLSKEAAKALGTDTGKMTPDELMTAILKAPVDLMWFGGIGTYVRASTQSNADADDRGNDDIRITAKALRVKVIGEGANLGLTHPARIEFASLGGACNSDAIDNSAGVNSSDVEVNIKIALSAAMKAGRLSREDRNTLLESMTADVSDLVLVNNYKQTLAISLAQKDGLVELPHQQRLMQSLEGRDRLARDVEHLPDDAQIAERMARGEPLTRPEIGVLLAYAKIVALDDLVASDVPDDPFLERDLFGYFPQAMGEAHGRDIKDHALRR
ncbi:MAG: NAD-glutamate dehydrogenase domain-containing protein, partial [Pseudomonadota bacterium]